MTASTRRWAGIVTLATVLIAEPSDTVVASAGTQQARTMKIRIDVDGRRAMATLDDTAASRDFISLLPLTLTLDDYNGTEKISDLPKRLSTDGAPAGVDPSVGDITYYAPWGNMAIFYKDFGYSRGLVKLGRIDSGADVFHRPGKLRVTIQRSEE